MDRMFRPRRAVRINWYLLCLTVGLTIVLLVAGRFIQLLS